MARKSRLHDPLINRRIKVGIFSVPITVGHLETGASVTVEALVDTGSTLTVLAGSALRRLGVTPSGRQAFELADGSEVEWDVGEARVTVQGRSTPTLCAFGAEEASPILGVV